MQEKAVFQSTTTAPAVEVSKVLRNTYMLLGLTLLNSALFSGLAMAMELGRGAALGLSLGGLVMLFVVNATANSGKGLIATFVFKLASASNLDNHFCFGPYASGTFIV